MFLHRIFFEKCPTIHKPTQPTEVQKVTECIVEWLTPPTIHVFCQFQVIFYTLGFLFWSKNYTPRFRGWVVGTVGIVGLVGVVGVEKAKNSMSFG